MEENFVFRRSSSSLGHNACLHDDSLKERITNEATVQNLQVYAQHRLGNEMQNIIRKEDQTESRWMVTGLVSTQTEGR